MKPGRELQAPAQQPHGAACLQGPGRLSGSNKHWRTAVSRHWLPCPTVRAVAAVKTQTKGSSCALLHGTHQPAALVSMCQRVHVGGTGGMGRGLQAYFHSNPPSSDLPALPSLGPRCSQVPCGAGWLPNLGLIFRTQAASAGAARLAKHVSHWEYAQKEVILFYSVKLENEEGGGGDTL